MKLKDIIPASIRSSWAYRRLAPTNILSYFRNSESIFSEIYKNNKWGGEAGVPYSGSGSRGAVVDGYVSFVLNFIQSHSPAEVIDLGCGDFHVGAKIAGACARYVGIDVVPELIAKHQQRYATDQISFACLDATTDDLPQGNICLIRQVFQHLTNRQITEVLKKCGQYRYVLVTEHCPSLDDLITPNLDKAAGVGTRVAFGSTVDLRHPPFNLSASEELVLPAPQSPNGTQDVYSRGSIRTYLLEGAESLDGGRLNGIVNCRPPF